MAFTDNIDSAGRPDKPGARGVEALKNKLSDSQLDTYVEKVEYFPSAVKGEGTYGITSGLDFGPPHLEKLGFSRAQTESYKSSQLARWSVPPVIMEKAIPGAGQMTPEDITRELRTIKGHEQSIVRELPDRGNNFVIEEVQGTTSRTTFVGEGGNKKDITMTHLRPVRARMLIPESDVNKLFEIEEGRKLA